MSISLQVYVFRMNYSNISQKNYKSVLKSAIEIKAKNQQTCCTDAVPWRSSTLFMLSWSSGCTMPYRQRCIKSTYNIKLIPFIHLNSNQRNLLHILVYVLNGLKKISTNICKKYFKNYQLLAIYFLITYTQQISQFLFKSLVYIW